MSWCYGCGRTPTGTVYLGNVGQVSLCSRKSCWKKAKRKARSRR